MIALTELFLVCLIMMLGAIVADVLEDRRAIELQTKVAESQERLRVWEMTHGNRSEEWSDAE